ncbi:MAG: ATPase [Eubacterium sp.]|nr:ATPase [Eubacterium sp.]
MEKLVLTGKESLGIEFGSTRIKAVLINEKCEVLSSGGFTWENRFENGVWTYHEDEIWNGLRAAYSELNENVKAATGGYIKNLASICFSAMMHGYLPFDKNDNLLVPFRTWRNTITAEAAAELTELFGFNIPQRWSIAHLYQAILNGEEHVKDIAHFNTLAGYVHFKLTGEKVLGIGDASGMFPIDSNINNYDEKMLEKFSSLPKVKQYAWDIRSILPKVLPAGANAGCLTEEGAALLDETKTLCAGVPFAPPEGDAGTGMVATNSVTVRTGNVSAGTSIFAMVVLEKALKNVYEEIDMVTTPAGKPVAMVHCNNCCTDLDYWVNVLFDFAKRSGSTLSKPQVYDLLYNSALKADSDCGGLINFNYFSGEPVSHTEDGRPLFVRSQGASFTLPNFFRAQLYSTMATLKLGMKILENEGVKIDKLYGHGGLFKTPVVGQRLMAGAVNAPVSVMKTAGEGGAWGAAVLAAYVNESSLPLESYLENRVFSSCESTTENPVPSDAEGFEKYMKSYEKALAIQKAAYENI